MIQAWPGLSGPSALLWAAQSGPPHPGTPRPHAAWQTRISCEQVEGLPHNRDLRAHPPLPRGGPSSPLKGSDHPPTTTAQSHAPVPTQVPG